MKDLMMMNYCYYRRIPTEYLDHLLRYNIPAIQTCFWDFKYKFSSVQNELL